jgi:hypothetical protein
MSESLPLDESRPLLMKLRVFVIKGSASQQHMVLVRASFSFVVPAEAY